MSDLTPQHPAAPDPICDDTVCPRAGQPCPYPNAGCPADDPDAHPAAPETETDANGLTEAEWEAWDVDPDLWPHTPPLHIFRALVDEDDNVWWRASGGHGLNAYDAAIDRIDELAERVRVVEGERDAEVAEAEREHEKTLAIMEAACDRADALQARAESAEAAHEAEKAAHERLRAGLRVFIEAHDNENWRQWGIPQALRSLLGGGEAR